MLGFISVGYVTGLICTSAPFSGQYIPACNKAMDALVIQTGVDKKVEAVKQFYTDKATEAVKNRIQLSRNTIIVGTVVYTAVIKQEVHITFRALPIAHSMSVQANLDSLKVGLSWGF